MYQRIDIGKCFLKMSGFMGLPYIVRLLGYADVKEMCRLGWLTLFRLGGAHCAPYRVFPAAPKWFIVD